MCFWRVSGRWFTRIPLLVVFLRDRFPWTFFFKECVFFRKICFFFREYCGYHIESKSDPLVSIFIQVLYQFISKLTRAERCFSWRVTWGKCPWESFLKRKESVEQNAPEMVGECHPLEIGLSPKFLWNSPLLWSRSWYGQIGCRFSLLWSRSWCTMASWYGQIGCTQIFSSGVKLFAFSWKFRISHFHQNCQILSLKFLPNMAGFNLFSNQELLFTFCEILLNSELWLLVRLG